MKKLWMVWGLALAMLGAVACGDDGGDGGTGDDDDDDFVFPDLPVAQVGENLDNDEFIDEGTAAPADFSCLGDPRTVGDTEATITMELADGTNRAQKNPGVPTMLLLDNTYAEPFASDGQTDDSGILTFQAFPDQLFGGRFQPPAASNYIESVQYNLIATTDMTVEASSAFSGSVAGFSAIVGVLITQGNGIISGALEDCNGEDVYGVVARFFRASDGFEYPQGPTYAVEYFDGIGDGSPTTGRDYTHVDGRYGAINLPGDQDTLIGIYGRTTEGGPIQLLSCEQHYTLASPSNDEPRITITTSRPLRPETASLGCPAP